MKIILVRHGQTEGNKVHKFIGGRTDEPVSREGLEMLRGRTYPRPDHVFSSPMLRCIQTAETIFEGCRPELAEGFRECDFGILEGKSHEELLGDPAYDAFIGRSGADTFPGGESIPGFNARCLETLRETVETSTERLPLHCMLRPRGRYHGSPLAGHRGQQLLWLECKERRGVHTGDRRDEMEGRTAGWYSHLRH